MHFDASSSTSSDALDESLVAGADSQAETLSTHVLDENPFMKPPAKRSALWRCAPCCWDPVPWRSTCFDCNSKAFIKYMTLFEHHEVEALFLHRVKSGLRARVIPPLVIILACLMSAPTVLEMVINPDAYYAPVGSPPLLCATAGLILVCFAAANKRLKYQLRVIALILAMVTATLAYVINLGALQSSIDPAVNLLALLWVCQQALVVSNVVAARILVVLVPINASILLAGAAYGLVMHFNGENATGALVRVVFELTSSILASSGVLLWVALRNESASRTVFYWSHIVEGNVDKLDAEANPFNAQRLHTWLLGNTGRRRSKAITHVQKNTVANEAAFWELDGSSLELEEEIAAGGGGVVWKARLSGNYVAAKQVYAGMLSESEQLEDLAAEVAVLAQLSHKHIVRFLGLCRHNDGAQMEDAVLLPLFIIQEYCATNLRAFMTDNLPSMEEGVWLFETARVAFEIASAMSYLHGRKIEHRDLKPENVFLTQEFVVRVGDFGISAQFLDNSDDSQIGGGTPQYMSPEAMGLTSQLHGHGPSPAFEPHCDVYAFGIILCELLRSDSGAGIADILVENAGYNKQLASGVIQFDDDDDVARHWKLPTSWDSTGETVQLQQHLAEQCCAFDFERRPSFGDIVLQLRSVMESNHPGEAFTGGSGAPARLRGRSATSDSAGIVQHQNPGSPGFRQMSVASLSSVSLSDSVAKPLKLSVSSVELENDLAPHAANQCGATACALSCWQRHRLLFPDKHMEARFLAFLHSEQYFRYLRWPFVVLAGINFLFAVAMLSIGDPPHAAYPLSLVLLFGVAVLFGCVSRIQRCSLASLTTLAIFSSILQCISAWSDNYTASLTFQARLANITGQDVSNVSRVEYVQWCSCEELANTTCPAECLISFSSFFFINFGLALFQGLTIPVTMLVLGLPCYLYTWLLALSAFSWLVSVGSFLAIAIHTLETGTMTVFAQIVIAGFALFPICAASAVTSERSRRTLFETFCDLRQQEGNLLEHASFRGYRDALRRNWQYLSSPANKRASSKTSFRHVVTTTTM